MSNEDINVIDVTGTRTPSPSPTLGASPGLDAMRSHREQLQQEVEYLNNIRKMVADAALAAGSSWEEANEAANQAVPAPSASPVRTDEDILNAITDAQAALDLTYQTRPEEGSLDAYFEEVAERRETLRSATQAARDAGVKVPGTGFFDTVGDMLSRASDYTGIPLPDLVTGGPGGVTGTWGTPTGKPVGTVSVPKTAGSTYSGGPMRAGVLTGIPAIDLVLSKASRDGDIFSRPTVSEIPSLEDITEILKGDGPTPGEQAFTPDTTDEDKKTEFGFEDKQGPSLDDGKVDDGTGKVDDGTGKVDDGTDLNKTPATTTSDEDEYLDLNKDETTESDETPETSDETPAGGGGGAGAGYTQGVAVHQGAPGDKVDLDYLYDISGRSIFAPRMREDEDDKTPYVYARSGGMIQNNYDLLDEIIRLLRD